MFSFVMFLAVITTILAFIGFDMITHFSDIVNLIGAVALGVGVFLTFKPNKKKQISLDLDDSELKMHVQDMQKVSLNILQYLQKHPEKITLARRFIDYYQDIVAGLIEKYVEIVNYCRKVIKKFAIKIIFIHE